MARRGHAVTVVERDGAPPQGTPSDDAERWLHPGVPQARQSHALLGRARRVLADEAPDVVASLLARGVREVPVVVGAGALDEQMLLSRRLVAEAELRRIVAREVGVTLLANDAVVGLQVSTSGTVAVVVGAASLAYLLELPYVLPQYLTAYFPYRAPPPDGIASLESIQFVVAAAALLGLLVSRSRSRNCLHRASDEILRAFGPQDDLPPSRKVTSSSRRGSSTRCSRHPRSSNRDGRRAGRCWCSNKAR